jgi:hypothetical protein
MTECLRNGKSIQVSGTEVSHSIARPAYGSAFSRDEELTRELLVFHWSGTHLTRATVLVASF